MGRMVTLRFSPLPWLSVVTEASFASARWMMRRSLGIIGSKLNGMRERRTFSAAFSAINRNSFSRRAR